MNKLYFGDNLDVMKRIYHDEHQAEFIDLIYNDPPFNSKRNYNVLFESVDLDDTKAQKEAFSDTWSNVSYIDTLNEIRDLDLNLYNFLNALDNINISKSAISYLATMSIRIWYMHKLLKPTGSFYLHCDPTMSHYLKIVCDLVFGEKNFRNEIVWKRTSAHNDPNKFGWNIDIILFFSKSKSITFNLQYLKHDAKYISRFRNQDSDGRKWSDYDITAKGLSGGGYEYEYKGINNLWRCPLETMIKLDNENKLHFTKNGGIRLKRYLDENQGTLLQALWDDIFPINSQAAERLGYPTQKPEALMDRIILASSNPGDLVADFFCGCGTTIASAQKNNRHWLGSDISHLAVKLITKRLVDTYGDNVKSTFEIHGFPKDLDSARELAAGVKGGRLLFEEWIVEVMLHGILNEKRNAMGYDGYFTFDLNGQKNVGLIEVKSGGATPTQLNHFVRTVEDKKAQMGVFVCFANEVTDNMRRISKQQGYFSESFKYEKIQIITVEDILNGKLPNRPASKVETFKQAERKTSEKDTQQKLGF
jgi:site-specific DNA-methyltransferase (adenine-specific)